MEQGKKILLDTNFLMLPAQLKVDIFTEFERICNYRYSIYILDKNIDELDKIIKTAKQKDKTSAKVAKELLKAKNINIISTENRTQNVDDIIIEQAKKHDFIVATSDKELKTRLRLQKIKLISLRKGKFLITSN